MIIDFVRNNQRIYNNIDVIEYKDIFIILHNFIFFYIFLKKKYMEKKLVWTFCFSSLLSIQYIEWLYSEF